MSQFNKIQSVLGNTQCVDTLFNLFVRFLRRIVRQKTFENVARYRILNNTRFSVWFCETPSAIESCLLVGRIKVLPQPVNSIREADSGNR